MPFIQDDEYIIYMDVLNPVHELLPVEDIQALKNAGIRTALLTGMDWNKWEREPNYIDRQLDRIRRAGMKVLLPLWTRQSNNLNRDWYSRDSMGAAVGAIQSGGLGEMILSPWSGAGQDRFNSTLRDIKAKYESDDCQIISYGFRYGECVMPNEDRFYDRAALKSALKVGTDPQSRLDWIRDTYTAMLTKQQQILVDSPWREVWFCLHYGKIGKVNPGCQWIDDYLAAWTKLQPAQINHITYSYFPFPAIEEHVRREMTNWRVNEWVGAEYCEGLAENTPKAIAQGLRGFVLSPCHNLTKHRRINAMHLREIGKSLDLWVGRS